jgi:hypothetical protein
MTPEPIADRAIPSPRTDLHNKRFKSCCQQVSSHNMLYNSYLAALAHLAFAALRALSRRCSAVNMSALALPPLRPPLCPSATASGSFPSASAFSITCLRTSNAATFGSFLGRRTLGVFLRDRFGISPVSHALLYFQG